jgi:tetratricopeptide (TPR) repeat protein
MCLALSAAYSAQQARDNRAEVALQAAIKTETIDGDLRAAIEAYKKVVATYESNRAVAAQALAHMGQCYEKLGEAQAKEARAAYARVVRDYADQAEIVAQARARLAALGGPSRTTLTTRRLENPPADTPSGSVSPDGRYRSFLGLAHGRSRHTRPRDRPGPAVDGQGHVDCFRGVRGVLRALARRQADCLQLVQLDRVVRPPHHRARRVQAAGPADRRRRRLRPLSHGVVA